MGYTTILDILGGMFVGGILLISLFRVQGNVTENFFYYKGDINLQSNLISIITVLENDLRRMGYAANPTLIPNPTRAVSAADTSRIAFVGDVDNTGSVDSILYFLGPTSELSNTRNPRDRILYRRVNGTTGTIANIGVTTFRIVYYNSLLQKIATPIPAANTGEIASIEISIQVESPDAFNENYNTAYWRQVRLSARNLLNR